ncbi:MAG: glycosyltransferase family 2 protein [Patescibacteria group bacterium]|nr:glycosyltransferase family 2 protein [Patescibacteria group bacterium]
MTENNSNIAIVIVNYNGHTDTVECLKSLRVLPNLQNCQIIVVDNNPTGDSLAKIKEFASKDQNMPLSFIANKNNLGFTGGNNAGIKKALDNKADFILLLNNDTLVDKYLLRSLLEFSAGHPGAGIIGPKIYFASGCEYRKERYQEKERGKVIWYAGGLIDWHNVYLSHRGVDEVDIGQFEKAEETDFVSGCAMFIKREVLEKIGLLDDKYFLYLEDADLCQRAKLAGFKIWFSPKGFLWHKNANASGKPGSELHVYYQTRNRLLFGFKYASIKTKFALWRESMQQLFTDKTKRHAILDFYLGHFGRSGLF